MTARVVRVKSWRTELVGEFSGSAVVDAGCERVMVRGGLLPR
jgi:hypothetical protein